MTFTPAYKPFDWQNEDLATLHENGYVALLNMEMGSGKTALATWAIERSGSQRVLIVAPDPTHSSAWIPTVRDLLNKEARPIGNTGKARKEALFDFELGQQSQFFPVNIAVAAPETQSTPVPAITEDSPDSIGAFL